MRGWRSAATGPIIVGALIAAAPLSAEVLPAEHGGFASVNSATVSASRWQVWQELLKPEYWWTHTHSGEAMNVRLTPRAGGCLCETVPLEGSWETGSVEHARVVAVIPEQMLRMSGSLGPLQSEGLTGTLTVMLSDVDGGTRISWEYIVGGAGRLDLDDIAPAVDTVQAEFLGSLAEWINQHAPAGQGGNGRLADRAFD